MTYFHAFGTIIGAESLTSVFEMGTGIAFQPWSPGNSKEVKSAHDCTEEAKPVGRLVPVSCTHCCAYTPGLSTW